MLGLRLVDLVLHLRLQILERLARVPPLLAVVFARAQGHILSRPQVSRADALLGALLDHFKVFVVLGRVHLDWGGGRAAEEDHFLLVVRQSLVNIRLVGDVSHHLVAGVQERGPFPRLALRGGQSARSNFRGQWLLLPVLTCSEKGVSGGGVRREDAAGLVDGHVRHGLGEALAGGQGLLLAAEADLGLAVVGPGVEGRSRDFGS